MDGTDLNMSSRTESALSAFYTEVNQTVFISNAERLLMNVVVILN